MDCCNYPGAAYAGGWDAYTPYAPLPYVTAAYAHAYYPPHAHDPYARYYRYDYPAHHSHHNDHGVPTEYGAYAAKETRVRRAMAHREARTHALTHLPLPITPPMECGMNGRSLAYCEPQVWSHYQMGVMGGGWGGDVAGGMWTARGSCARDSMRYTTDCRPIKAPHMHSHEQVCRQDETSTPYPNFEERSYNRTGIEPTVDFLPDQVQRDSNRISRERVYQEARPSSPPELRRPPVVPLPAFQQAFGSLEIGKFSEAFSRTEVKCEEEPNDNFGYEAFQEWEGATDAQWPSNQQPREVKCEHNY